jgi:hypothetical protein
LSTRKASLFHQRRHVDPRLSGLCAGKTRYHTGCAWR